MGWLSKVFNPVSSVIKGPVGDPFGGVQKVMDPIQNGLGTLYDFTKQSAGAVGRNPAGIFIDPIVGENILGAGQSLISPTGNWSKATWDDMAAHATTQGQKDTLNTMNGVNKVADIVAPLIAGYYAAGSSMFGPAGGMGSGTATAAGTGGGGLGYVPGMVSDLGGGVLTGSGGIAAGGSLTAGQVAAGLGGVAGSTVGATSGGLSSSSTGNPVTDLGNGVLTGSYHGLGGAAGAGSTGLGGVGAALGAGAATGGITGMFGNGGAVDPNIPHVDIHGHTTGPGSTGFGQPPPIIPNILPADTSLTPDQTHQLQTPPPVNVTPPAGGGLPSIPPVVPIGGGGGGNNGTNGSNGTATGGSGTGGINTGGLGGLLGGLLGGGSGGGMGGLGSLMSLLYGAYSKNNIGNSMQGIFDQLNGMYKPGTPEYDDMRHRIEARDAAAGRRSQYGPRERELAASMADSRMRTLTSPGFFNIQSAMLNNQPESGGLSELFGSLANNGSNDLGGILSRLFNTTGSGSSYNPILGSNANDTPSNTIF